jgi:NMD protein affecting ribosome stability and mRNA decay
MSKRVCDVCGKEKDVAGGKTCENGHFICKDCYWKTAGILSGPSNYCPICKKPLR